MNGISTAMGYVWLFCIVFSVNLSAIFFFWICWCSGRCFASMATRCWCWYYQVWIWKFSDATWRHGHKIRQMGKTSPKILTQAFFRTVAAVPFKNCWRNPWPKSCVRLKMWTAWRRSIQWLKRNLVQTGSPHQLLFSAPSTTIAS